MPCHSIAELAAAIRPPRPIIIMVQAGKPVDEQIALLRRVLSGHDIIIDAGNANFRDTMRRFAELDDSGLTFIGMGVSGGEEGARHGPSIMVGGTRRILCQRVESVLTAIAAKFEGEPCCAWLGEGGAGHFVKTIHNGIEYADMQMIAEIYGVLRDGLGMQPKAIGEVFGDWNKGRLNSYLIEITAKVLAADDPKTGKPVVDIILDRAGQKGTGKLVGDRSADARRAGHGDRGGGCRAHPVGDEERARRRRKGLWGAGPHRGRRRSRRAALRSRAGAVCRQDRRLCARLRGHGQASKEFGWNLPLPTIAKIWRAGCIIRSQFLGTIAAAFGESATVPNLLMAPAFIDMMKEAHPALRRVVALAAGAGLPMPALSSALAYFDSYRQGRGTSNLIQAQRDFFGAHGFERIDAEGAHPWTMGQRARLSYAQPGKSDF